MLAIQKSTFQRAVLLSELIDRLLHPTHNIKLRFCNIFRECLHRAICFDQLLLLLNKDSCCTILASHKQFRNKHECSKQLTKLRECSLNIIRIWNVQIKLRKYNVRSESLFLLRVLNLNPIPTKTKTLRS